MSGSLRILVIGASYGALLAAKAALAGHRVTLVGRAAELEALARHGASIDLPLRSLNRRHLLHFDATPTPGPARPAWGLALPQEARPEAHDLAFLVVQEPQAAAPELLALLRRIVAARLPLVALMNLAPLSWLQQFRRLHEVDFSGVHAAPEAWAILRGHPQTLASPDAQAVRPDPAQPQRLRVTLATNWKCAPFRDPAAQALLSRLARDIDAVRLRLDRGEVALPVRLVAGTSPFVPFAKLPMLIAGNLRSVRAQGEVSIREAVTHDLDQSQRLYHEVVAILQRRRIPVSSLVPFARYARAAESLTLPSSTARALAAGARRIERPDLLLQALAGGAHELSPELREVTEVIEMRLVADPSA